MLFDGWKYFIQQYYEGIADRGHWIFFTWDECIEQLHQLY